MVDAPPIFSPNVPAKITTPDTPETRIGTLRYQDGTPDAATVQMAYDQLDFGRGADAFLKGYPFTALGRERVHKIEHLKRAPK